MLIWSLKRRSVIVLAVTAALVASAAAVLLSIADMGGFDPSRRVVNDPIEGRETQAVENPARPEHPGFPPPVRNNLSSSSGVDVNNSLTAQALLEPIITAVVLLGISK